jgi:hypothetical protein
MEARKQGESRGQNRVKRWRDGAILSLKCEFIRAASVCPAGVLFIANRNQLFALKEGAMTKPATALLQRPGAHAWSLARR